MDAKWLPSISGGFSYTNYTTGDDRPSVDIWSWMVGLQWKDVFVKGNSAGFAVGAPLYVTSSSDTSVEQDAGYMYELFYKFRVSDNISVTPAVFWITKNYNDGNAGQGTYGGVIQTTFKF